MKNLMKLALTMAICTLSLASCQKDGVNRFKGNYSFKTSGTITVLGDQEDAEEQNIAISSESGQMDITSMGEDSNLVITQNVMGGDMVVYYGSAEGKTLTIGEGSRHLVIPNMHNGAFGNVPVSCNVTVSGEAQRYDNIILFDLRYEGEFKIDDVTYTIVDSDIVCRAKMNE